MENSLFNLLLTLDASTISYVRQTTNFNAVRTVYLRLPEEYKTKLLAKDSDTIANFNKLLSYLRPDIQLNTIDRYRRIQGANMRANIEQRAEDLLIMQIK